MIKETEVAFTSSLDVNEVTILKVLGSGGFGTVHEGIYRNQRIALKRLHTNTKNKKAAMQSFQAECRNEVLSLDHPNIIKTLAVSSAFTLEDEPCLLMEFVSTRTLQHVIDDTNEKMDFARKLRVNSEISNALVYIHNSGIVHLDLKPANVLIADDGSCKIGDFGCCQFVDDQPNTPTRSYLTGTFAYRAPELLRGESPTFQADVYSFAICMWQIWTREVPYKLQNHQVVIFRVVACSLRPQIPTGNEIDNRYKELMTSAWAGKPTDRPTMGDIKETFANWRI
ncbi:predicted protein [Nematostella vectensis]|uniref:non-specific serine/threonine protein kinase n=1 Tax=Nematostella vectensis TaxID=45351 RepID=A7SFJ5_NEMVE|nr:predicted protein [Nematostella vectensis]|eukprot:XP_001629538.1 predicted protein [Nematostella vectensis]